MNAQGYETTPDQSGFETISFMRCCYVAVGIHPTAFIKDICQFLAILSFLSQNHRIDATAFSPLLSKK
jgi:hypothetical protein